MERRQPYLRGGGESPRWRNRSSSNSSSCSKTGGWGRGMCVTMWRENAWLKGDVCCWGYISCFHRKLTRVFLRYDFTYQCFIPSSGPFCTIFLRILWGSWGRIFLPSRHLNAGEERERRTVRGERSPTGRLLWLGASQRIAAWIPDQALRFSPGSGGGEAEKMSPNDFYPVKM